MAVCAGANGDSLVQKLESLNISPALKQLATLCRLFGNCAVHKGQIDFSVDNKEALAIAEALSDFVNRLADEIFGTQATIQKLEEKLKVAHS